MPLEMERDIFQELLERADVVNPSHMYKLDVVFKLGMSTSSGRATLFAPLEPLISFDERSLKVSCFVPLFCVVRAQPACMHVCLSDLVSYTTVLCARNLHACIACMFIGLCFFFSSQLPPFSSQESLLDYVTKVQTQLNSELRKEVTSQKKRKQLFELLVEAIGRCSAHAFAFARRFLFARLYIYTISNSIDRTIELLFLVPSCRLRNFI